MAAASALLGVVAWASSRSAYEVDGLKVAALAALAAGTLAVGLGLIALWRRGRGAASTTLAAAGVSLGAPFLVYLYDS